MVGAKVTVRDVRTRVLREDLSSSTGDYNFPLLDVGEYEVTVEMPGFKTQLRKGIVLESPALCTDEAALGQVVDRRRLTEMPLNGRNLAALAVLQPGVQFGGRMGFDVSPGRAAAFPSPGRRSV